MPIRMYNTKLDKDVFVYGFVSHFGEVYAVCYGEQRISRTFNDLNETNAQNNEQHNKFAEYPAEDLMPID